MVTMKTTNRLGVLACPPAGYVGSEAPIAFGGSHDMRWLKQRPHQVSVHVNDLIPSTVAGNGTGLSAPPERSP